MPLAPLRMSTEQESGASWLLGFTMQVLSGPTAGPSRTLKLTVTAPLGGGSIVAVSEAMSVAVTVISRMT